MKQPIVATTTRFAVRRSRLVPMEPSGKTSGSQRTSTSQASPPRLLPRIEARAAARLPGSSRSPLAPRSTSSCPGPQAIAPRSAIRPTGLPGRCQTMSSPTAAYATTTAPIAASFHRSSPGDETAIAAPSPTTARRAAATAADLRMATA